jgi:hypothetical protein
VQPCRFALKSAIPSVEEQVGHLEGIGEQAVATLKSLANFTYLFCEHGSCFDSVLFLLLLLAFCCVLPVRYLSTYRSALKSAIPSVEEPVGRLEGIGEQAVATLKSLSQQLEDASRLPQHLQAVEKVSFKHHAFGFLFVLGCLFACFCH